MFIYSSSLTRNILSYKKNHSVLLYICIEHNSEIDIRYEYLWADDKKIKKPIKVSAPEYADYLMTWVQGILEDESVFPTSDGDLFYTYLFYTYLYIHVYISIYYMYTYILYLSTYT